MSGEETQGRLLGAAAAAAAAATSAAAASASEARAWGAVGQRMEPPPPGAANTAAPLRTGESGAWRLEGPVHDPKYPSRPRGVGGGAGDVAWPKPCWCSAPHRRHYGWWTCLWHSPLPSPLVVDLTVA